MRVAKDGGVKYTRAEVLALSRYTGYRAAGEGETPGGCEHCDGEHTPLFRIDSHRGYVCPLCDDVLDEMLDESPEAARRFTLFSSEELRATIASIRAGRAG